MASDQHHTVHQGPARSGPVRSDVKPEGSEQHADGQESLGIGTAQCPGCHGLFPAIDGPTHAYLTASVGCWARFGQALALHYSDYRYWPAHQLLTDAYALQHSHGDDRRSIQSVHVHLAALYSQVFLRQAEARVIALRQALSAFDFNAPDAHWPKPSTSIATVDMSDPDRHRASVEVFAAAVLSDWADFHGFAERLCRL